MQNYNLKFKNFTFFIVILSFTFLVLNLSVALATAPTVILVSPANGSTNVPQRPTIAAYFDKDIDPATITNDVFKLKNKFGTNIDGEVSYSVSERKASFELSGNLPYDNEYTVTLTTGITDTDSPGNHLASDYVWKFTTTVGTDLPTAYPGCSRPVWEYVKCPSGEVVCPDVGCPTTPATTPATTPPASIELPSEETENTGALPPPSGEGGGPTTGGGTYTFPTSGLKSIVPCGTKETPPCTICHLFMGVNNIIKFLTLDIATPLAVVVLIYGGVMILTSGGSEDKLKKGETALWMTIWGLVIVFASFLIIGTIMGNLVKPGFLPWESFPGC